MKRTRLLRLAFAVSLVAWPTVLSGQVVRGQVVDSITRRAIVGSAVVLLDSSGRELAHTVTNAEGLFLLQAPSPAQYRLRSAHDGYRLSTFPPFTLRSGDVRAFMLLLAPIERPADNLAVAEAILDRVCPDDANAGRPVLLGVVRDVTTGETVAGAEVALVWSSAVGVPPSLRSLVPPEPVTGVAVTGPTGRYVVCGAPPNVAINVLAFDDERVSHIVDLRFREGGVAVDGRESSLTSDLFRLDFELRARDGYRGGVTGAVTGMDSQPVADAEVRVTGTPFADRTDAAGRFTLPNLPPGPAVLSIRRVGFRSVNISLTLDDRGLVTLADSTLRLQPMPSELEPIVVEAPDAPTNRELVGFERRRAGAHGRFITRDEFHTTAIDQETTDVLRRIGGFRVDTDGFRRVVRARRRGRFCYPLVFRDGIFLGTTNPNGKIPNLDDALPIAQVDAIEVYNNPGAIPSAFNRPGASCGAIVFWTRRARR